MNRPRRVACCPTPLRTDSVVCPIVARARAMITVAVGAVAVNPVSVG
jgi:hypothetical protein